MVRLLRPFLDHWRLTALVVSAAMLAVAHAFETFGGLAPCELCLKQREVYWAAGALALAMLILVRLPGGQRFRQLSCWLLAAAFLVSVGVAGYHAGVEWRFWPGPQTCSGASRVTLDSLKELLNGTSGKVVRCDQPAWVFLGLSMAGWNTVASAILTALSVAAALRERGRKAA